MGHVTRRRRLGQCAAGALALICAGALCMTVAVSSPAGSMNDLMHFKYWTQLITVEGMHSAYSGTFPKTYAIYPPVTLATFRVAGALYQRAVDPSFDLERALASPQLNVLIRLQAIVFHLLVGLVVLIVAGHAGSFGAAYAVMLAYLFNPGIIFDVGQWGQPDPVYGLFVLLALAATAWGLGVGRGPSGRGQPAPAARTSLEPARSSLGPWMAALAGAALVLAALAKPQAWVYVPLVTGLIWRRGGVAALACSAAAGAVAAVGVALPYLLHGTLPELIGLQRAMRSVMPVVSANAHNLWWWASGSSAESYLRNSGAVPWTLDSASFLGPFSYHLVALGLVAGLAGLALLRVIRAPTLGAVFVAGAYTAFSFFMAMTQIHENHMYAVFPLLAVAMAAERRYWAIYVALTLTWTANLVLYDFDLTRSIVVPLLPWSLAAQERLDVAVNVLVLAVWTSWIAVDTSRAWLARPVRQPAAAIAPQS